MPKHIPSLPALALAACAFELNAGNELQLLPAGDFHARDGRPTDAPRWRVDAAIAARLIAQLKARTTPLVIDYEHQTLNAEYNGKPAPAAGWFSRVEWREGKGLYALDVEWTAAAAELIGKREYRFLSPVFSYDKRTGAVTQLLMAAITNHPALDGMDELHARAAARFSSGLNPEEPSVNEILKAILLALGLAETASQEDALAAVDVLKKKAGDAEKDAGDAKKEIAALKAAVDPATHVPIEAMKALQEQVAALTARITADQVDTLVRGAIDEGKLLPAQEAWARAYGKKDVAALSQYLDSAPTVAALQGTQTGGKEPGGDGKGGLSADELAVCKATGISADDFKKAKGV